MMETFTLASDLAAPAEALWAHITSLPRINEELAPLRMTYPPEIETLRADNVPLGQVLVRSWVLLFGVLPLDRHALCLTEVAIGEGFREESTSWLQRRWLHDRRITPLSGGCRVTDHIGFEPRLALLRPLLARVVRATFARRHRRLRERFGPLPA
jgi:hypothetical protein